MNCCWTLVAVVTGLDEDAVRDREEHEDREEDKTDQSESEEEEDDKLSVDDSIPPVETPYCRNSTEELGQVRLILCLHYVVYGYCSAHVFARSVFC